MENADDILANVAAALSHDVRAPVRLVLSFSDLLEARAGDSLDEAAKELLGFIRSSAQEAETVLACMVDYLRIPAPQPEAVPLASVVPPGWTHPDVHLQADPELLRRVVQEIDTNMRRFGAPPMTVTVEGDALRFHHDGEGVPERFAESAFALFRTLSARDPGDPPGMGLAVVRRIMELHGGSASFDAGDLRLQWPSGTVK